MAPGLKRGSFSEHTEAFATTMQNRDGPSPARTKIVTNYNQQHRYYTAVDRHARNQLLSRDDLKEHLPVEGV